MQIQRKLILTLFFSFVIIVGFAQQRNTRNSAKPKPKPTPPSIVKGKVLAQQFIKNNILKIRFAPSNHLMWAIGNKYGYKLERFTIKRNDKLVTGNIDFKSYLLKPDSLNVFEPIIDSNNNAAVMAQALYGETFELDINKGQTMEAGTSILAKSEEGKQRFAFAMYAADNDFNVASLAGLGFVDSTLKKGEEYFYRITALATKKVLKADTAFLLVNLNTPYPLPEASEINAEPSNNSISLVWDMERTKQFYNAFNIERGETEQGPFKRLNDIPYTSFSQKSNPINANLISYLDTGLVNLNTYYYRINGINIFGEEGPFGKTIFCKSLPLLEGVPGIQGIRLDTKGKPILNWYFEDSIRPKVKGFQLLYTPKPDLPYTLAQDNIGPEQDEVILSDSLQAGYLVIKAVSKEGLSRTSFPYLFQPEDSTAPAVPKGLKAVIDTFGKVTLNWLPNPEKDLLGYKVFRTLVKGQEHAILVDTVFYGTTFYDQLDLKLKSKIVYYAVTALDFRQNQSYKCKDIEVVKPDKIKPTAPVFDDFVLKDKAILIKWINSTDDDIIKTILYKKNGEESNWTIFKTFEKNKTVSFEDTAIKPDAKYSYKLANIDEAGNQSDEAQILNITAMPELNNKAFTKFEHIVDRNKKLIFLKWDVLKGVKIKSIEVFKSSNKEPLTLYKVLNAGTLELLEDELIINTVFKYGLRALLSNGQYTTLITKEINY